MVKKRKFNNISNNTKEEGPPDVSPEELEKIVLSGGKLPPNDVSAADAAGGPSKRLSSAAKTSANREEVAAARDAARLAIELLEAAVKRTLSRTGWFRDVRLRRAAEKFLSGSALHQSAIARVEDATNRPYVKPSHEKIIEFESELHKRLVELRTKLHIQPKNEKREINLRIAGPGKAIGKEAIRLRRLAELKGRSEEFKANPRSVIKSNLKKKTGFKLGTTPGSKIMTGKKKKKGNTSPGSEEEGD